MAVATFSRATVLGACLVLLTACGNSMFGGQSSTDTDKEELAIFNEMARGEGRAERMKTHGSTTERASSQSIFSMLGAKGENEVGTNVNRYLWNAALDTLSFLPVETVDPFTGVISTGYGTPPGSGQSYRATIYISDPALDARSLKVALQTRGGGAVSAETVRQVEDAILSRARQLRVRDSRY
jgi:hypothetical protein